MSGLDAERMRESNERLSALPMSAGTRVYRRRSDLFGVLCETPSDAATVLVKWEWPWDPAAEPEKVLVSELVLASEVE